MAVLRILSVDEAKLSNRDSFILVKRKGADPSYKVTIVATEKITKVMSKIFVHTDKIDGIPAPTTQQPYVGYISGKSLLKSIGTELLKNTHSKLDRESIREVFNYAINEPDEIGQVVAIYEHFRRTNKTTRTNRKKTPKNDPSIIQKIRNMNA